jgi:hypothetical protein
MNVVVPLSQLSRELTKLTGQPAPPYRALWMAVVDARIPAEQVRGRYHVDVRKAAETLGLIQPAAA